MFLIEAKQAGIFEIRNVPEDQMSMVIGVACPQIVYPYLRGNVADLDQPRRLPARAPGGNQLPGHVTSSSGKQAAAASGRPAAVILGLFLALMQ